MRLLLIVLLVAIPLGARAQSRVVVVPFTDVSAVSGKMPSPTLFLVDRLTQHFDVAQAGPIDPIFAVTEAGQLCKDYAADDLVVGTLDLTLTPEFAAPVSAVNAFFHNATPFANDAVGVTTGLIGVSGLLNRTAIQARVRLYVIGCRGDMRWTTTTVANAMHNGNNIGAGFTQIVHRAIAHAVDELGDARL